MPKPIIGESLLKGAQKIKESVVFEENVKTLAEDETDPTKQSPSQKSASRLLQTGTKSASTKPSGTTDFLRGKFKANFPVAASTLTAYLGFRQPGKAVKEYLIPKDRAAWLDFLVNLVKKKTNIEYLNDRELRKVIQRARPNLAGKKPVQQTDHDSPLCLFWSAELVSEWISRSGFPYLKEAFLVNNITGRRLILVDCTALNQMGMQDLTEMRKVTAKIRELLKITKPNILRALMRIPPYEAFLRRKVYTGVEADSLTFEKFCKDEGFNYFMVKNNKNLLIPCTCEVRILPLGVADDDDEDYEQSEEEDLSLLNAPTVEFIVRTSLIRDKTVSAIIEEIMNNVFMPNSKRKYGKIIKTFQEAIYRGYEDLEGMDSSERLDFAAVIAKSLLDELEHTAEILSDIDLLQKYVEEDVTPKRLRFLQKCATEFMEYVLPIASLLALGQLDLETIFRQEPEFEEYVDEIIEEAELKVEEMILSDDAFAAMMSDFVDEIVEEALFIVEDMQMVKRETQHDAVQVDFPDQDSDSDKEEKI